MKQELSTKKIWNSLSDFWQDFKDKEVFDQLWRGYYYSIRNLYYQLYQVDLSKCIHTIPYKWISDWERFTFDSTTRILDDSEDYPYYEDYPYRYRLPSGVKNVTTLREGPREVSHLQSNTVYTPEEVLVTPSGQVRYLEEDTIYEPESMIVWDDSYIFPDGIDVDTKIFTNGKDFIVDETTRSIHFNIQPYETLWSNVSLRDVNSIYANFGYLIDFPGENSYKYLKQVQGMWYSYWMGATVRDLERGLTIALNLPYAEEDGIIESITTSPRTMTIGGITFESTQSMNENLSIGDYIISINEDSCIATFARKSTELVFKTSPDQIVYLRATKNGADTSMSLHDAMAAGLLVPGSIALTPTEDFDLLSETLRYFYVEVSSEAYPDVKFLLFKMSDDQASRFISGHSIVSFENDELKLVSAMPQRLSRSVIQGCSRGSSIEAKSSSITEISLSGQSYVFEGQSPITYTVGDFVPAFETLTDAVKIYDYINRPSWTTDYGVADINACYEGGGAYLDTAWSLDSGNILDALYTPSCMEAAFLKYFTFIVSIDASSWSSTSGDMQVLKTFLKAVKPAYTNYIFQFSVDISDDFMVYDYDMNFEWTEERTDRPYNIWVLDDESGVLCDTGFFLDNFNDIDSFFEIGMTLGDTVFDDHVNYGYILDDEAGFYLDDNAFIDSMPYPDSLEFTWTKEVPEDMKREKTLVRGETFRIEVSLYQDGDLADYDIADMYSDALFEGNIRKTLTIESAGPDMPGRYILKGDFDTWRLPGDEFQVNIGVYDNRGSDPMVVASFNDTFYIVDSATDLSELGEQ